MQKYKLPKVKELPDLTYWFSPPSFGPGDVQVQQLLSETEAVTDVPPEQWTQLKGYNYSIPKLQELKKELDMAKAPMDEYNANEQSKAKLNFLTDRLRPWFMLKMPGGLLEQEYQVGVATNAYLKMIELLTMVPALSPAAEPEEKPKKSKAGTFRSFHMAEAPGNFILALNHYLYSRAEHTWNGWEWRANTMEEVLPRAAVKERGSQRSGYLDDTYGIMRRYRERWLLGADGDGDITSSDNLRSFGQDQEPADLVTSDVKVVPADMDFNKEEIVNIPVQMGHLLGALLCLRPGGSIILKEFTKFESMSVCLLMLACYCFREVHIVKPLSSREGNSEMYVVATHYETRLAEPQMNVLLRVLRYIRYMGNSGYPALFRSGDLPGPFLAEHAKIQEELVRHQIKGLTRNYRLYEKYKATPNDQLLQQFAAKNEKLARQWLATYPLKPIDPARQLIARDDSGRRPGGPKTVRPKK